MVRRTELFHYYLKIILVFLNVLFWIMCSRRGQGRVRKTRSLWLGAMIQLLLLFLFCFVLF